MRLGMRKKHCHKVTAIFVAALSLLFIVSIVIAKRLQPVFVSRAHAFANTIVTDVIEETVNEVLSEGDYSKSANVITENGVSAIESDTEKINKLKSELTVRIQDNIAERCNGKIYVPIGSASGLYILSGTGPKIPISVIPAATVNTNYVEDFKAVGINQVKHSVYINVDVNMHYSGYMLDENEIINTDVLVLETIIIGGVPNYYGTGETGIMAD